MTSLTIINNYNAKKAKKNITQFMKKIHKHSIYEKFSKILNKLNFHQNFHTCQSIHQFDSS